MFSLTLTPIFNFVLGRAKGMDKGQRKVNGKWVNGKESALWVSRCAGPAARHVAASLRLRFGLRASSSVLL